MFSRSIRAGNICLRCQLRLLDGPRPSRLPRHRIPFSPTLVRTQRLYSSKEAWDKLDTLIQEDSNAKKNSKPNKTPKQDGSEPATATTSFKADPESAFLFDALADELEESIKHESSEQDTPGASQGLYQDLRNTIAHDRSQQPPPLEPSQPEARMIQRTEYDKVHRSRRGARQVVLKPEGLSGSMLGGKAHAIIMRDDKFGKPRRQIPEDPDTPQAPETTSSDLQAFLAAAEAEPSSEEAIANIDELRPEGTLVLRSDFWTLHQDLSEGFTTNQILNYIAKQRKTAGAKNAAKAEPEAQAPKGYAIQPLEKIEIPPDMSPKARKALVLMLDAWKIDIWERVEGLSHVTVGVKDPAVAMVLNTSRGRGDGLEDLRSYLQAGESLTWDPEKKTLTVVARRAIIETIMDQVNIITKNIAEGTIYLMTPAASKSKEAAATVESLLDELCRHTKVTVGPVATRNGKTRALWVKPDEAVDSPQLEDMAHVMWRLLYTAHAWQDSSLTVLGGPQAIGSGRLDVYTRYQDRLPWKDRTATWARWMLPVERDAPVSNGTDGLASKISLLEETPADHENDKDSVWPPSQTSLSTTFGHVLFQTSQEPQDAQTVLASDAASPRTLIPITPTPDGLKPLDALLGDTAAMTTMVLRFAVGPDHIKTPLLTVEEGATALHPSSAARYIVELHLDVPDDIPEDGILTWDSSPRKSIRAILATSNADIPLPESAVDMRITSSRASTLTDAESLPYFKEFLDSCSLDLANGRLRTPSTLEIPQEALAGLPKPSKSSPSESLEFLGLEVRRAVQIPFEGHTLSYSSIEAGLHGGRRAELSLAMTPADAAVDGLAHKQQYLDLALALAQGRFVHWGEGLQAPSEDS